LIAPSKAKAADDYMNTKTLFGILVITLALSAQVNAQSTLAVTIGGGNYDLSYVTGTFTANESSLESEPWWGNGIFADSFANAIVAADPTGQFVSSAAYGEVSLSYSVNENTRQTIVDIVVAGQGSEFNEGYAETIDLDQTVSYMEVEPVPEPTPTALSMLTACAVAGRGLWSRVRHRRLPDPHVRG
jgi:hypothetical protein